MAGIADKFVKLKTSVGGNREKTGYEDAPYALAELEVRFAE